MCIQVTQGDDSIIVIPQPFAIAAAVRGDTEIHLYLVIGPFRVLD
jgi:hypothetical protein